MPKVEITQKGVYMATGKKGQSEQLVEVGTVIDTKTDEVPGYLIGKCRVVGDAGGKSLQANEPDVEALYAEYEKLTGEKLPADLKVEDVAKKLEEAKSKK